MYSLVFAIYLTKVNKSPSQKDAPADLLTVINRLQQVTIVLNSLYLAVGLGNLGNSYALVRPLSIIGGGIFWLLSLRMIAYAITQIYPIDIKKAYVTVIGTSFITGFIMQFVSFFFILSILMVSTLFRV